MRSFSRIRLSILGLWLLAAASPAGRRPIPEWLLGDWTPVEIRQDADGDYLSNTEDPKHWLAGQHLTITQNSLTLNDDRCMGPRDVLHRDPLSMPLHEFGGGTLESLGLPKSDKPVDYIEFVCSHDLLKSHADSDFTTALDRTIQISWFAIIHSDTEIDMPFFGGSYVKFKKVLPTT